MDLVTPPHWFRSSSTTRAPKYWLAWYALPRFRQPGESSRTAELSAVSGQVVRRRDGGWHTASCLTTIDPERFVAWLNEQSREYDGLQCVTHWLTLGATLIRLWERMARREYQIHDTRPPRPSRKNPDKLASPSHGLAVTADPPAILNLWHRDGFRVNLIDLRNYLDKELPDLAKMVGLTVRPWDQEETDLHAAGVECEARVAVVRECVCRMVDEWTRLGMGGWRPSIGGLASSSFRIEAGPRAVFVDKDPLATAVARQCYYGGETRLYRVGKSEGVVYELDVVAAYLWAMGHHPHPVRHLTNLREPTVEQLAANVRLYWCGAIVRLENSPTPHPVRRHGLVRYCQGSYWTALAHPELVTALRDGVVKQVYAATVYRVGRPFHGWAESRWHARRLATERCDKVAAAIHKLLGNSLYGRWVMRTSPWRDLPDQTPRSPYGRWMHVDLDTNKVTERRSIGWCVQEKGEPEEHPDSVPAIGASITSLVRQEMRRLISIAHRRNVYWQCVDAIHVTPDGLNRLAQAGWIDPDRVGCLGIKAIYENVEYNGPYDIRLPAGQKTVGLKHDAIRHGPTLWKQWVGPGLEELLSRGVGDGYSQTLEKWIASVKMPPGEVGPDGCVGDDVLNSGAFPENLDLDIWGDRDERRCP